MLRIQKSSALRARPLIVRQALAALFMASIFALFGAPPKAEAATIDLTGDVWDVEGFDEGGNVWDGSTLFFETQTANGENYDLTGYFDWVGAGPLCPSGCSGRELFTGTLFSDFSLELNGGSLIDPVGIVLGAYSASALDGQTIINGIWGPLNTPVVPGEWTASRGAVSEVPLPAALPLFLAGLAGLGFVRGRKQKLPPNFNTK